MPSGIDQEFDVELCKKNINENDEGRAIGYQKENRVFIGKKTKTTSK